MKETSQTILEWAFATFGRTDPLTILLRANEELAELFIAYQYLAVGDIGDLEAVLDGLRTECADVVVMVSQVVELLGGAVSRNTFDEYFPYSLDTHNEFLTFVSGRGHELISGLASITYRPTLNTPEARAGLAHIGIELVQAISGLYDRITWAHGSVWDRVESKMQINRNRNWVQREDGAFQHDGE